MDLLATAPEAVDQLVYARSSCFGNRVTISEALMDELLPRLGEETDWLGESAPGPSGRSSWWSAWQPGPPARAGCRF